MITLAIAALAVGVLGFWLRGRSHVARPAVPTERVTIANIGIFSIFNLIAQQQGYFLENGLDATVEEYDSGGTSMAALLEGRADFAIAADFVGVNRLFAGSDLKMLAQVSNHDVWRLIARRDRGVTAPSDMRGKRIGVTRKTQGEYFLGRFLTLHGMSLRDVVPVDLSPVEMTLQLERGDVDAVMIFEPHAHAIENRLGGGVIAWSGQGGQRALGLAYATGTLVERRPDLVERYLRAIVQAEAYVRAHEAEAKAFLAQALRYDEPYLERVWPNFEFGVQLNQALLLSMEDEARWIMDNGLTDKAAMPNYLDHIYFDGLAEVAPSAVTILH